MEQAMFEDYGYTEGCEGCRFQKAGMGERRGHSEECRRRITERMQEDEAGRARIEENEQRINRRSAEIGEEIMEVEEQEPIGVTEETTTTTTTTITTTNAAGQPTEQPMQQQLQQPQGREEKEEEEGDSPTLFCGMREEARKKLKIFQGEPTHQERMRKEG